jgi:hypothetical protein
VLAGLVGRVLGCRLGATGSRGHRLARRRRKRHGPSSLVAGRLLNRKMGSHVRIALVNLQIFVVLFGDGVDTAFRSGRSRTSQVRGSAAQGSTVLTISVMVVRVNAGSPRTIARSSEALPFAQGLNLVKQLLKHALDLGKVISRLQTQALQSTLEDVLTLGLEILFVLHVQLTASRATGR